MIDEQTPRAERSRLPIALVALLPILYLASLGPLYGLGQNGYIPAGTYDTAFDTVYFPIAYISRETDFFEDHPLGRAYGAYVEWFK